MISDGQPKARSPSLSWDQSLRERDNMKKVAIFTAMAALAVCVAAILPLAGNNLEYEGAATMQFDRTKWTDAAMIYEPPYVRRSMVDDVMKNRISREMRRADVIDVLGEPTETPYFKDYDLVYWLGEEKGFVSVDSAWLVIKFGANERVSDFKLVTD